MWDVICGEAADESRRSQIHVNNFSPQKNQQKSVVSAAQACAGMPAVVRVSTRAPACVCVCAAGCCSAVSSAGASVAAGYTQLRTTLEFQVP